MITNINDAGGNLHIIVFLDSSLAIPAVLTEWTNCAKFIHMSESDLAPAVKTTDFEDEDGVISGSSTTRSFKAAATLRESHKALVDFLHLMKQTTVLHIRYNGVIGGKYSEYFTIESATGEPGRKTPGGASSNKYGGTLVAPDAAVTFSAINLTAIETALSVTIKAAGPTTISAGKEFEIVETTIP
jgi:hypothetical protein